MTYLAREPGSRVVCQHPGGLPGVGGELVKHRGHLVQHLVVMIEPGGDTFKQFPVTQRYWA